MKASELIYERFGDLVGSGDTTTALRLRSDIWAATAVNFSPDLAEMIQPLVDACTKSESMKVQVENAFRVPIFPLWVEFPLTAQRFGILFRQAAATSAASCRMDFLSCIGDELFAYPYGALVLDGRLLEYPISYGPGKHEEGQEAARAGQRFGVICCALLNSKAAGNPILRKPIEHHRAAIYGRAFLASKTLQLILPRQRVLGYVTRWVSRRANGLRAHLVMGSWCERHSSGRRGCIHSWAAEPDNTSRQSCACGRRRWWRDGHQRGDASKGYLDKMYHAVTRAEAA